MSLLISFARTLVTEKHCRTVCIPTTQLARRIMYAVVDVRINKFLAALRKIIVGMDDEEWASHIAAVVTAKTEPDKRLSQEATRQW